MLDVQIAKNRKEMPYFQTKQFCHGTQVVVTCRENWNIQNALFFKTKDDIYLETWQEINL